MLTLLLRELKRLTYPVWELALIILLAAIFLPITTAWSQDNVGSGRAILFDGVDDYIDLGDIYDNLTLPVTISAWVNIDIDRTYAFPIFNSQDNLPIYNGITFTVQREVISVGYGDGRGENNSVFRRAKSVSVPSMSGRWVNVTAIMRGAVDMSLYLNGYDVGGQYGGNSDQPMKSLSPGDVAKIGYWFSNGITTRFEGMMDELRLFNRALTVAEIREQMCKRLKGNEAGLIGYWNFDETSGNVLKDSSPNHFDGQLKGNPVRVFSGAPVGDESNFIYTAGWSGATLTHAGLTVETITGNPFGAHIYKVNNSPSQVNGLAGNIPGNYYGVFIASNHTGDRFYVKFNNSLCRLVSRKDNSVATWANTDPAVSVQDRTELIFAADPAPFQVDLGADVNVCNQVSYQLSAPATLMSGRSVLWNTGETTPSITVTRSGEYFVKVSQGCKTDQDTVNVSFQQTPTGFTLGEDEILCNLPRTLQLPPAQGLQYTWHDGSRQETYEVKDYGRYWVKAENFCGTVTDSITFTKFVMEPEKIPNVITPNGDALNQHFMLSPTLQGATLFVYNRWGKRVYQSLNYKNEWDGGDLDGGVYFYVLSNHCLSNFKSTVHILR